MRARESGVVNSPKSIGGARLSAEQRSLRRRLAVGRRRKMREDREWGKGRRASAFAKATADMMADMTADRQDFMVARGERGWTIAATIAADDCERSVYAFQATPDLRFAPRREGLRERAMRAVNDWEEGEREMVEHLRAMSATSSLQAGGNLQPATCNFQLRTAPVQHRWVVVLVSVGWLRVCGFLNFFVNRCAECDVYAL